MKAKAMVCRCDLLKIHYLCGNKDNEPNSFNQPYAL